MNFIFLVNCKVFHKKFGNGIITDVTQDKYALINFNGTPKMFVVETLHKFFEFADQNVKNKFLEQVKNVAIYNPTIQQENTSNENNKPQTLNIKDIKNKETKKDSFSKDLQIEKGVLLGLGKCENKVIKIPNTVTSIAPNAFKNAELKSVFIPNTVTTICESAFENCTLKHLTIGSGVTEIGANAFANCKKITRVNFLGSIDDWTNINFCSIVSNPTVWSKNLFIKGKPVTNAVITTETKNNTIAFLGWMSKINARFI